MKYASLLVLALGATTITGCEGLSQAFTAHTDVAAKAGSQELSVTRLGDLIGKAKIGLPVNKDVATLVARDLWIPYQLLGIAAAHNDSLTNPQAIDSATASMLENARLQKFMEGIANRMPVDTGSQSDYLAAKGDLYSARHILFMFPQNATPAQKDSVRKAAQAVVGQVNAANFADMAKKYSKDNTAARGGDLGVFPRGMMVKPFGDALAKLKPGEISPLVETQFGYHIIQRNTWDQAKAQYAQQSGGKSRQAAESTYLAQVQASAKITLAKDAATSVKEIAKDPLAKRGDSHVIATYSGGKLTTGRLAMIMLSTPQSGRLMQQIQSAPDSLVNIYATNMAQRDVLLHRADSAKVALSPEEMKQLHTDFGQAVLQSWAAIGIDPKALADSAKTPAERERLAASRVEAYLDKVMAGGTQPAPVPVPLEIVLLNKYDGKVNATGVERAVERATKLRVAADSARTAGQPKSSVPLPGAQPSVPTPNGGAPVPKP
jgi:peptidyl-prolyl cis-trans isomerase D